MSCWPASSAGAEGPGDLPCAGKGAAALAASAERHYLDALEFDPARLIGICDDPPRPWRADPAHQGDRGRPSGARRKRA